MLACTVWCTKVRVPALELKNWPPIHLVRNKKAECRKRPSGDLYFTLNYHSAQSENGTLVGGNHVQCLALNAAQERAAFPHAECEKGKPLTDQSYQSKPVSHFQFSYAHTTKTGERRLRAILPRFTMCYYTLLVLISKWLMHVYFALCRTRSGLPTMWFSRKKKGLLCHSVAAHPAIWLFHRTFLRPEQSKRDQITTSSGESECTPGHSSMPSISCFRAMQSQTLCPQTGPSVYDTHSRRQASPAPYTMHSQRTQVRLWFECLICLQNPLLSVFYVNKQLRSAFLLHSAFNTPTRSTNCNTPRQSLHILHVLNYMRKERWYLQTHNDFRIYK